MILISSGSKLDGFFCCKDYDFCTVDEAIKTNQLAALAEESSYYPADFVGLVRLDSTRYYFIENKTVKAEINEIVLPRKEWYIEVGLDEEFPETKHVHTLRDCLYILEKEYNL